MDSKKTFRIIVIVTVSTLFTVLSPVESKYVSLRSLLSLLESPSPATAPASALGPNAVPESPPTDIDPAESDYPMDPPANSPTVDSPVASPEAPADCNSPANPPAEAEAPAISDSPTNSPAKSPAPAVSDSPTNSPAKSPAPAVSDSPTNSPAKSPAPAVSGSPTNSPAKSPAPPVSGSPTNSPAPTVSDSPTVSPAKSPAPAVSDSPASPPSEENSVDPSGKKVMSAPKDLLNQPLLSPEIKSICGKTDNPPLCESSVTPLLTPETKQDANSVLVLVIQASINATKAAMATVKKVSAADCQELYDDAVTNLEDAINAVNSRDIHTVNINLSAAMTDYGTCNDGFEETGEPNPLADVSDKLTKLVSNCLAISTLIK